MRSGLAIDIDSVLIDVEVLAERVTVMVDEVDQDYFGQEIKDTDDAVSSCYDAARIKIDIANHFLFDMQARLKELRELVAKIS